MFCMHTNNFLGNYTQNEKIKEKKWEKKSKHDLLLCTHINL